MQGHKRGAHFSLEIKQKVLQRVIKGNESRHAVAEDMKLSVKTIENWMARYKAGKLPLEGKLTKAQKAATKAGPKKGVKQTPRKHKTQPAPLAVQKAKRGAPHLALLEMKVSRLQAEVDYLRRDRAALEIAVEALS